MELETFKQSKIWSDQQLAEWRQQVREALQPDKLLAWLRSFPAGEIVGIAGDVEKCVVAQYLRVVLPWLDCRVGANQVFTDLPQLFRSLLNTVNGNDIYYFGYDQPNAPDWLRTFILEIDKQVNAGEVVERNPIYVEKAIDVLLSSWGNSCK